MTAEQGRVTVALNENTERFRNEVEFARDGEWLIIRGYREREGRHPLVILPALLLAVGTVGSLAVEGTSERAGWLALLAVAGLVSGLAVRPRADLTELRVPAERVRLVPTDPWSTSIEYRRHPLGITPDPYRLAIAALGTDGREMRFDFHAQSPEDVAALLSMLAA